ncbi:MAG UNVERIFIED_CONTAM: LamG domain-containing protein [Planctomycetaceae bacterium]
MLPRFLASGTRQASPDWQREHSQRLRDPFLTRCYVFTGPTAHIFTRNLAAWHGSMIAATAPKGRFPRSVAGREDTLQAVRIEDIPLESMPAWVGKQLTVELRVRHHGQGFIAGGNSAYSGTLAAMGDGIWNGFLFAMHFPSNTLSFQLGRPKPEPALPVTALSRIPAEVCTHLAATWDGSEIRIYVNGLLAGRRLCAGPFNPVPRSSRLRVGYVGNGLGCGSLRYRTLRPLHTLPLRRRNPQHCLARHGE